MTLNRGEGGQNVMSDDFYDALGLVRTEELLSADRYYGVQQFFGTRGGFRIFEDARRSTGAVGPRPGAGRRRARGSHDASAGGDFGLRGRTDGRPRPPRGGGRDGAGSVRGGGRSECVSRADSRGAEAVVAAEDVCARAVFPGHRQGNVRLRHREMDAGALLRLRHKTWTEGSRGRRRDSRRRLRSVLGATYLQIAREGWALQKSQNGGGGIPLAGPAELLSPFRFAGAAADKEQSSSMAWILRSRASRSWRKGQAQRISEGAWRINARSSAPWPSFRSATRTRLRRCWRRD